MLHAIPHMACPAVSQTTMLGVSSVLLDFLCLTHVTFVLIPDWESATSLEYTLLPLNLPIYIDGLSLCKAIMSLHTENALNPREGGKMASAGERLACKKCSPWNAAGAASRVATFRAASSQIHLFPFVMLSATLTRASLHMALESSC